VAFPQVLTHFLLALQPSPIVFWVGFPFFFVFQRRPKTAIKRAFRADIFWGPNLPAGNRFTG